MLLTCQDHLLSVVVCVSFNLARPNVCFQYVYMYILSCACTRASVHVTILCYCIMIMHTFTCTYTDTYTLLFRRAICLGDFLVRLVVNEHARSNCMTTGLGKLKPHLTSNKIKSISPPFLLMKIWMVHATST